MDYFKINYDKLKNLNQINFFGLIIFIILMILVLVICSCFIKINKKISFYGIYNNGVLQVKIDNELSDIIKKKDTLIFNDEEITYQILSFEEYETIENKIFQTINLTIDKKLYNNEIGKITINYDRKKLITYIFELFK